MPEWYCIISGRTDYGWEKLISEKVIAVDRKSARQVIEDNYCRTFPMRIRGEDVKPESVILAIYEMVEGEYQSVHKLFHVLTCEECGESYRMVDSKNLNMYSNHSFCSDDCYSVNRKKNFDPDEFNQSVPVIYRITEITTGFVYIGKTTRSFTLRWWEHLKSKGDCKFHKRLRETSLTDWRFEVLEVISTADNDAITRIESEWIRAHDSIANGYNTVISNREDK